MSIQMENLGKYAIFYLITLILFAVLNVGLLILSEVEEVNTTVSFIYNELTHAEICEN